MKARLLLNSMIYQKVPVSSILMMRDMTMLTCVNHASLKAYQTITTTKKFYVLCNGSLQHG